MMEYDKKIYRKKKRFAARLKSSKQLICTDEPGTNVVLCNAGQASGLEKSIIVSLIKNLSGEMAVPKFIAEKGESHSFLVFNNIDDAQQFYNSYDGKFNIGDSGTPLYMSFVETVPNNEITCEYENPKGLSILEDFISTEEEQKFLQLFDWVDDGDSSSLKNRQVKHYGYEFRYGSNDVDLSNPLDEKLPQECCMLFERLRAKGRLEIEDPDQLTVNKYKTGQGIPSHVDRHSPFGQTILSLSLGSDVVMDWKHHSGKHVPIVVKRRSMIVMKGEARYDWQHGIQPRTQDPMIETRIIHNQDSNRTVKIITNDTVVRGTRISLTFRWTRSGPCECAFRTLCDSEKVPSDEIENHLASNLEELHVHQVYEQIAGHFSTTRHTPWPRVLQFMQDVAAGAVVLDLGAGNGKNILHRGDILQIAGERSSGLLSECQQHTADIGTAQCVRLDLLSVPLRDGCADAVLCIAVIHHFSSRARRLQAISTISRLLRSGGRALITVWAKDQTKSNYLLKSKQNKPKNENHVTIGGLNLPVHENRTPFQHNDLLVPWKLRNVKQNKLADKPEDTLLRYYHVFEDQELAELCRECDDLELETSFYDEGNWCVICKKI
ncbi:alkylated DNA repair protein alkB homolog 8 [Plodia interpunctella]|uniref:alkylated DNA repair protein alkB homolog 8 n=1 Tax=Plodia interpunctella TaxID=58824 RepID=UPI002367B8F2|nr:alkylated DNA repair protein alkB homolog 8 [Plodia interpunctella]